MANNKAPTFYGDNDTLPIRYDMAVMHLSLDLLLTRSTHICKTHQTTANVKEHNIKISILYIRLYNKFIPPHKNNLHKVHHWSPVLSRLLNDWHKFKEKKKRIKDKRATPQPKNDEHTKIKLQILPILNQESQFDCFYFKFKSVQ